MDAVMVGVVVLVLVVVFVSRAGWGYIARPTLFPSGSAKAVNIGQGR